MAEEGEETVGGGAWGYGKHKTQGFSRAKGDGFSRFDYSSSVVTLGFKLHWGSSVQQDVSCLLLMHCCKVFDVHYRLKKKSASCILHQRHRVSSSMVLNIASISNFWKMYGLPVFLLFLPICFNNKKKKKKKQEKKGIFSSIVRSDMWLCLWQLNKAFSSFWQLTYIIPHSLSTKCFFTA